MRILFLSAKLHTVEPFGLMCLAPALKRGGHEVRLLEAEDPSILDRAREFQPDIIGYSVCTGAHRYYLELNRFLKRRLRYTAVFGGPHPTFFPHMIDEEGVDAVCRGEGDLAMAEFCRRFEATGRPEAVPNFSVKVDGRVTTLPPRPLADDLDRLDFADRELYYGVSDEIARHRVRSFLAARGCPFACSYCFNHTMDEVYDGSWRMTRTRSPENLVDEIAAVVRRYPTEFVAFRESIFPLNVEWLKRFSALYPSRVGLPFYCHVRLDLLTEERVELLARTGCHSVNVGIETGNERLRRTLLGRNHSNATLIAACAMLRKRRIRILANNMLGLPGAGFAADLETLRLNQQCKPDYALAMLWQPYPGTDLTRYAKEHGYYDGEWNDVDFTYYNRSPVRFRGPMERRRTENLQKLFAVAAAIPATTGIVTALTRLPQNRIFKAVFRTAYLVFHQTEIFAHRMGMRDWAKNIRHIVAEA